MSYSKATCMLQRSISVSMHTCRRESYVHIMMAHQSLADFAQTVATRSGYLNKRGKQNLRYSRQWFILKGDVLSYYNDASDLYFPNGHIDLRYAVSASLVRTARIEASLDFEVVTSLRKYQFRADSAASAKEWVKTLQKIIFQAHVDGDSVKVVLPVRTILDVEPNPVIGLAETVKIRAIDDEETYAIDEVC